MTMNLNNKLKCVTNMIWFKPTLILKDYKVTLVKWLFI